MKPSRRSRRTAGHCDKQDTVESRKFPAPCREGALIGSGTLGPLRRGPGNRIQYGFGDQAIGTRCQARAQAKFDIEHAKLEISHPEYLLPLLFERQEISDLAEVAVVFDADKTAVAEIARKPCNGEEIGVTERVETQADFEPIMRLRK